MTAPGVSDATPFRLGRVLVLALVLRAALFPFAENKHGDAPMRALIAQRLTLEPAAAADPRAYCQFGPLHPTLMRAFIAFDPWVPRSSRLLSLVAGLLVFLPFARLATRLVGPRRAELAAVGLAVSPLALQASTTAASESLYLLLFVAMLERLSAALDDPELPTGAFVVAGALASAAALTRYDAWFAIPAAVAAAWVTRTPRARSERLANGLAAFLAAAATLPVVWVGWSASATGEAFFFAHYISGDHAQLAATAVARFGPTLARLRQVGIWALAFVAAMTPVLAGAGVFAAFSWRARARLEIARPALRFVLVAGLAPIALYLGQGLLRLRFEPLPRFALVPGALLLPLAAAAVPRARLSAALVATPLVGLAFSAVAFAVATAPDGRMWGGAESMGALTRLDDEDRALVAYLRAHRAPSERVMLEPLTFADIAIAEEAGVPATESISLTVTRTPSATVAETARATGARWFAAYDHVGGWARTLPDWPRDAVSLGRWRLVYR